MTQQPNTPIQCVSCKASSERISQTLGEPFDMCNVCSHFCEDCPRRESQEQESPASEEPQPPQQTTCQHLHTYHTGGFHYNGDDVWDDTQEVCIDCGAILR